MACSDQVLMKVPLLSFKYIHLYIKELWFLLMLHQYLITDKGNLANSPNIIGLEVFEWTPKTCLKLFKWMISTSLASWKPHTSEEEFKIGATNESTSFIFSIVSMATASKIKLSANNDLSHWLASAFCAW